MRLDIPWTIPDDAGYIQVPDALDPLINKIGTQLRMHTISGKNEGQTVVDMVALAQEFFRENPGALTAGQELKEEKTDS